MGADIRSIDTGKTDADLAKEYREKMTVALQPVVDMMNEARGHGLILGFQVMADPNGRQFVGPIQVTKPL